MKSLKLYLGILLIVSLLASCKHNKTNSDANGVFEAVEILVSAETSGKILQFAAIEGQKVAA
ncbi:MAG: hypothetical protein LBV75_04810, partial [Paludibacter sp.]|nr:hypothetical protein [Paludibacter sp.]